MQVIVVNTAGPQGAVGPQGPTGPTGSSLPFTNTSGSDSWFTTSSIQLTGSLYGTGSYAIQALSASYAPITSVDILQVQIFS